MSETEVKVTPLPQEHVEFFVQATLAAVIRCVVLWIPPALSLQHRAGTHPADLLDGEFAAIQHTGRILRELCLHLTRKPADIADCLLAANDFGGQIEKWIAAAVNDPDGVELRTDEAAAADLQGIEFASYVYKDYPDIEAASTAFVEWMIARAEEPA
jgi:hypothetical protein